MPHFGTSLELLSYRTQVSHNVHLGSTNLQHHFATSLAQ